jgi:hypothetical protein
MLHVIYSSVPEGLVWLMPVIIPSVEAYVTVLDGKLPTFSVNGYILIGSMTASTYALVAISVVSVGVARLVIFYEFMDTDAVGAVILFSVVVFA